MPDGSGSIDFSSLDKLFLISGPCVIESEGHCLDTAGQLKEIGLELSIPLIFKASFDKANRTSLSSFRGPGLDQGLEILQRVREEIGLPVTSDVHETAQVGEAARVLDSHPDSCFPLQTDGPDCLCRRDREGSQHQERAVSGSLGCPARPRESSCCGRPGSADNGAGEHPLVTTTWLLISNRFPSCGAWEPWLSLMARTVFSSRVGRDHRAGDKRSSFLPWVRAALAVVVHGLFLEVHQNPEQALSDGTNALRLERPESGSRGGS